MVWFYDPTIVAALISGAGTQNITGALFTNTNTFFGATVGRGAVAITGALYTDADTFYGSTVGRGAVTITGAIYTDADTFYAATITVDGAPQTITGGLFSNTNLFYAAVVALATQESATSTGSYNMYRLPDEPKRKLRKIKYIGPAEERLTFHVEATQANKWIPSIVRAPSVLEKIERNGLMVRKTASEKLRRMIMADDEWFMLN